MCCDPEDSWEEVELVLVINATLIDLHDISTKLGSARAVRYDTSELGTACGPDPLYCEPPRTRVLPADANRSVPLKLIAHTTLRCGANPFDFVGERDVVVRRADEVAALLPVSNLARRTGRVCVHSPGTRVAEAGSGGVGVL